MINHNRTMAVLLREHWFFPAALAVISTDLFIGGLDDWSNARLLETGVILDLAVVVPALYYWCYRSRGRTAILRTIVLSCLGLWAAGLIVPAEHQLILTRIEWMRYAGLAIVVLLEIRLIRMVYRAGFSRDKGARSAVLQTVKKEGMPEWVARVLVWEASVWRKFTDFVRAIVGRR